MQRILQFAIIAIVTTSNTYSQSVRVAEGHGEWHPPVDHISDEQRAHISAAIAESRASLQAAGVLAAVPGKTNAVTFGWPVRMAEGVNDYGMFGISNFVDQNTEYPDKVQDYNCGSRSYDTSRGYNHQGVDIFTWPFGWSRMFNSEAEVVAAAPGVIVYKSDFNYDRSCSLSGGDWNAVYVEHADGSTSWYGHLKTGSLTYKRVGQTVEAGEFLGVVGSSGNSTGPHLHFETHDFFDNLIDPFAGACNELNAESWWAAQPAYREPGINALRTYLGTPVFRACPQPALVVERSTFAPGATVTLGVYYRDQMSGLTTSFRLRRPDGSIDVSWTTVQTQEWDASYSWFAYKLPSEIGLWSFEADYNGKLYTRTFAVMDRDTQYLLEGVYPNPIRDLLAADLIIAADQTLRVAVVDLLGREVAVPIDRMVSAGEQLQIRVDASAWGSGVYTLDIRGEKFHAKRAAVKGSR
ncbi:MAG: peptidoglycan DD-metalloendopeptidase family protein [Bacteroidetes bacterium]|nr:peptidoglycan DD-metalloendopeptidase family protein [Bacteroidota bacterium]